MFKRATGTHRGMEKIMQTTRLRMVWALGFLASEFQVLGFWGLVLSSCVFGGSVGFQGVRSLEFGVLGVLGLPV